MQEIWSWIKLIAYTITKVAAIIEAACEIYEEIKEKIDPEDPEEPEL